MLDKSVIILFGVSLKAGPNSTFPVSRLQWLNQKQYFLWCDLKGLRWGRSVLRLRCRLLGNFQVVRPPCPAQSRNGLEGGGAVNFLFWDQKAQNEFPVIFFRKYLWIFLSVFYPMTYE